MPSPKDVKKSAIATDNWLAAKQAKHVKMIEKSLTKLQDNIIDNLAKLVTDKTGRVEGLKTNLKQAQGIHRNIENLFANDFSNDMKKVINDFDSVEQIIEKSFGYLDESVKFTGIDRTTMEVLKNGYWQNYLTLGDMKKNQIIQAVYDHVIANSSFSELVSMVRGAVIGERSVTGTPLAAYARTYANDFIMNFHNEVNLTKAQTAGLKYFLYIGNIIADSRPFCKTRAGNYYTANQINSWTYRWKGKSGPAMTHRGGYNCRHHWQPIRKEWMEGAKQIEVQNWFTE